MRNVLAAVCLAVLLVPAARMAPMAGAQTACPGLYVRNASSSSLDEAALCAAAKPWLERGTQVYIFATDERPESEDAWFAVRDGIESAWGIYNPVNDTFARTALAVEVSTVTSKPWGQDIAFGEALFGTPLDNDAAIARLEGRLKNQVAAGDLTAAITDTLAGSFATAFGAAQPPSAPTSVVVSPPGGPAPPVSAEGGRSSNVPLVAVVALILAAVVGVPAVLIPWLRRRRRVAEHLRHLADLRRKVGELLVAARTLFEGDATEETVLWRLFVVYGGDRYAELSAEVRGWVEHAMQALNEALLLSDELGQRKPAKGEASVTEMVRAYELLYVTLVGTTPELLAMDEEAFRSFIDPLADELASTAVDDRVVAQVSELRRQMAAQPLQIELLIVDPKAVDADGIFGYARHIKDVLARLSVAQAEAPPALAAAHNARQQAAAVVLPDGLEASAAWAAVDTLLSTADDATATQRWLDVAELAGSATVLTAQLADVLAKAAQLLRHHDARRQQVQAIEDRGFRLNFLAGIQQTWTELLATLYARIRDGDVAAAQRSVEDMEAHSSAMLRQAQALVELREHNVAQLKRLAAEVARVEALRTGRTAAAWSALTAYPSSNWLDRADAYAVATRTLHELFDDPGDADDLASTIERKNSIQQQAFEEAARELPQAFAALAQAEAKLEALIARLGEVREIERTAASAIEAAQADLERAIARRDRDDVKIDSAVDEQLELAQAALHQARDMVAAREFTTAGALIERVRMLATQAYAAADAQSRAIDQAWEQLQTARAQATSAVEQAKHEYAQLPPPAIGASTAALCSSGQALLDRALVEERRTQSLQDQALAAAIEQVTARYGEAERAAREALAQVHSDRAAYEQLLASAQAAWQQAHNAIAAAQRDTAAADAGGVGGAALQQAERQLPAFPAAHAPADCVRLFIAESQRAQALAETASAQARSRIDAVQTERRRHEQAERRKWEAEAAERRRNEWLARAAIAALASSAVRSGMGSAGGRGGSFGGSRGGGRSSSMGSSVRR